jgi:hypothetical protein
LENHGAGLGLVELKLFGDDQAILTHQLRQNGANSGPIHLLIDLLRMVLGDRRKDLATAAPQGAANGAGTGAARTLLPPGLATTTTNLSAGLLRAGSGAAGGQIGHDPPDEPAIR